VELFMRRSIKIGHCILSIQGISVLSTHYIIVIFGWNCVDGIGT